MSHFTFLIPSVLVINLGSLPLGTIRLNEDVDATPTATLLAYQAASAQNASLNLDW